MSDPVDALVTDLLDWIGNEPRPYPEVIEAWRTSCPRLRCGKKPIGEDFSSSFMCRIALLWSSCLKVAGHCWQQGVRVYNRTLHKQLDPPPFFPQVRTVLHSITPVAPTRTQLVPHRCGTTFAVRQSGS